MQGPDYDEDLFEEKSKLVYRRKSSTSQQDFFREPLSSRTDSDEGSPVVPFRGRTYSDTPKSTRRSSDRQRTGRRISWSEMSRTTDPIRDEMIHGSPSGERRFSGEPCYSDTDIEIRRVKKTYSYKLRKGDQSSYGRRDDQSSHGRSADQSSYGGRDGMSTKASTIKTEDTGHKSNLTPAEQHAYCPVTKWDVDYTNRNYVRSKCNKPTGLHRHTLGRQFKWDVDYDNAEYIRSNVNAPKGLHRRPRDIKRKRVPDNDVLADSTGWEFEYGPEFLQVEEDVPFMPDERVVGRGAYRCYGVGRSCSDTDVKDEEKRLKIPGLIEDEFKYGAEFLQDDVQHTLEQKNGVIGRGAYRFYEADRSHCDKKPCDMMGVDYRESRTGIDHQCSDDEEDEKGYSKGKPFKRTVLKKIVKLNPRPSDEKLSSDEKYKYGTHLKCVPGLGTATVYEGTPTKVVDRDADLHTTKHPSIRSTFQKKNEEYSRYGRSDEGFHCEERYSHKHYWDQGSPEQSYGAADHYDLYDRKDNSGKARKTTERNYGRELPKREKRPLAQSLTSYESCNLCDRKEIPGRQNRTVALRDESCDICEKKKSGKGKRVSPDGRGTGYPRGSVYLSGGYPEKSHQKQMPEGSHVSFDSCDLCDKPEVPRVATPKHIKETKNVRTPRNRDTYAKKASPPYPKYDRQYGGTDVYEKRKKTSPREYRSAKGDKFQTWKEREKTETRPMRMTGSLTQRQPKNARRELNTTEKYQRFHSQYAFPVEMTDDGDSEDEEMMDDIPSSIENRINEIKREISETSVKCKKGKGFPKRLTDSKSKRRASKAPKEPKDEERFGRFPNQCIYAGHVMIDDDYDDEEMTDEIPSSIENRINEIKKKLSETCIPREKLKGSSRRQSDSRSQRRDSKVPKEPKHKERHDLSQDERYDRSQDERYDRSQDERYDRSQDERYDRSQDERYDRSHDERIYAGEMRKEDRDISSEEFVPHVESTIQIVKKKVSKTNFQAGKKKTSPKRMNGSASLKHPTDGRKEGKIKDRLKNHRDTGTYSIGRKENGKILEKFPSGSGSRIQSIAKKKSPTKRPVIKAKCSKEYSPEDVDEFSDSDEIDFEEHKNHPKDHGKSFKDGYEKYVNQNGSEIWIKTEERYSELHHVP